MHHLRLLPALLLFLLWPAATVAQTRPAAPLFEEPGLAQQAVEVIAARIGHLPLAAMIDLAPDTMTLSLQGDQPHHLNRWTWTRGRGLFGTRDRITGPDALPSVGGSNPDAAFFEVTGLPLDRIPDLIAAAQPRTMLEEPAPPSNIRIEKPPLGGGEERLMMTFSTGRETSHVYFDRAGQIVRTNVSGTSRARGLDMARDDWHLPLAEADLRGFFGDLPYLRSVEIEPRDIDIIYDDPMTDRQSLTGLRWTLDGLSVLAQRPSFSGHFAARRNDEAFSLDALDFSILPDLKAAALTQAGIEGLRVTKLVANRPVTGTAEPRLVWTLTLTEPTREDWTVVASPDGEILRVTLPPGRRPQVAWYTPANLRDVLDRLGATFPPGPQFVEIVFNPERGRVLARDATDPGLLREFRVTNDAIAPAGNPMQHRFGDADFFAIDALAEFTAERISDLVQRTHGGFALPDSWVSRLTFSLGNLWVTPPEGAVMLEIRVEARGGRSGRLTFLSDGTEIDRVNP